MRITRATFSLLGLLIFVVGPACGGSGGGVGVVVTFQPAQLVVGQPGFTTNESDHGTVGDATATGLTNPGSVSTDGAYTLVADTFNHRVVGFLGEIATNFRAADFVIGQTDFGGETAGLGPSQLDGPRSVCVHDGRVYVADTENNRVLIWAAVPLANEPADWVLGQVNLTSNTSGSGPNKLEHPGGVTVAGGRLFVADSGNNRILVWTTIPSATDVAADLVLGQPDLLSNAPATDSAGMAGPAAVWSDGTRLVVADAGNCRVMVWHAMPTVDGTPADVVWGQSACPIKPMLAGVDKLAVPMGVASDGVRLFVSDSGNHRILVFNGYPTSDATPADAVLGQSDFDHTEPNDDDQDGVDDGAPTARTLSSPTQIVLHGGRLYVPEFMNHRVTIFALE